MKKSHLYSVVVACGIAIVFAGILVAGAEEPSHGSVKTSARKNEKTQGIKGSETPVLWDINCSGNDSQKMCSVSQEITLKKDNQRVLQMAVMSDDPHSATGTVIFPFGLNVSEGVSFQVDQNPVALRLPFSTCLPQGVWYR